MVHFHMPDPEEMEEEIAMLALMAAAIAYRIFGGQNEWLRTHGIILLTYYAIGAVMYDQLEGWEMLDSFYFMTVTVTTVGYGDLCPESPEGKIFTVFYALLGLVFVFAALSPLLDALMWVKDLILDPCTPPDRSAEMTTSTRCERRATGASNIPRHSRGPSSSSSSAFSSASLSWTSRP